MKTTLRTWTALGAAMTTGTALSASPLPLPGADSSRPLPIVIAQESGLSQTTVDADGEGGGEGGGAPALYALRTTDASAYAYDASAEIKAYADLVYASYQQATTAANRMYAAIDSMLSNPSEQTLAAARAAWTQARPYYMRTEPFRFYDGPIEKIEGRLNAWPLNEAFIDYVEGNPDAGIVNDPSRLITLDTINGLDQADDETDVTTGWHAIEFLLWGQDLSDSGPGARPYTDYLPGIGNNDRRRQYLTLVTEQLVTDLAALTQAWAPGVDDDTYDRFVRLDQREAIGRMVNGMAVLAGFELLSERIAVGLDSGDQEDEHSCFSDTTHQDFTADFDGIARVWTGGDTGPGLRALMQRVDPEIAENVDALLADAKIRIEAMGDPWDRVLASDFGSPEREVAETAVTALQDLTSGLVKAGTKLGVLVLVPGT